ncbi:hypothetical protein EV426DRAFT_341766 [Tirmania nivea]|nr:hypothetical protein EV426DRAFT_341766 [Tirmania nivea]
MGGLIYSRGEPRNSTVVFSLRPWEQSKLVALSPRHSVYENMSNKSLKLAVRVEIWHNFSPIIRENIEDKINKGVHHLWGGLGGGKGEDEFPWKLYIHSEETEEDGNFTVHFKHRKIRDSDPDLLKGSEIQKLCKKMLDSDPQSFARKIGIDGGALNWKPVSGGDNLSWQDRHFGMTYCIQLLERLEIQEGVPNILSHGPLQSMVLMSDTLAWFTSHIEQLQAMLPAGNTADNSTRAPFVLLRCLKASIVLQSSMCQWSDMPAKDSKSTLGSEVQSSTELFMAASTGAMQIIGELTANAS